MEMQTDEVDGITIVTLQGDLDNRTVAGVQETFMPLVQPECRILVNMGGVVYISSVGLRTLLLLYREVHDLQGRIILCCLPEMVHDTMLITGFLEFFETYPSLEAGRAAFLSTP